MKESHSKILLAIESLFLLLPLTMLTAWYAIFLTGLYQNGLAKEPLGGQVAPAFTFLGLIIQSIAWWAVFVFLLRGREGIAQVSKPCIMALYLGAVLVVLGGLSYGLALAFGDPSILGYLVVNALGLPALIPFMHVAIERHRAASNNSFKPRPLRGSA